MCVSGNYDYVRKTRLQIDTSNTTITYHSASILFVWYRCLAYFVSIVG